MIADRLKRSTHIENDIAPTLPTPGENLMLPEEYLMGWAVAEVQYLIYPGDADVFAGNVEMAREHITVSIVYSSFTLSSISLANVSI
jgi:hypothetical protein